MSDAIDALSDGLRRLRMRAWRRTTPGRRGAPAAANGDGPHGVLHVVLRGTCRVESDGLAAPAPLAAVGAALWLRECPHALVAGAAGAEVASVGFTLAGELVERLAAALPPVVWLDAPCARALAALLAVAALAESPGAAAVRERTLEALVLHALHGACGAHAEATARIAAPAVEPAIADVLRLIDGEPGRSWTVASLARAAGMSRSVFAQRFVEQLGVSPHRRLVERRMAAAASLLEDGGVPKSVAAAVGYRSRGAFSKAFRAWTGSAPGRFRAGVRRA